MERFLAIFSSAVNFAENFFQFQIKLTGIEQLFDFSGMERFLAIFSSAVNFAENFLMIYGL